MTHSTRAEINSYRDLEVWRLAMEIVPDIYRLTQSFPSEEKFGLVAQLRRAAVAIPSNIAEGHCRLGKTEFRHFVSIARGSVAEVETQLAVAVNLEFVTADDIESLSTRLNRLSRMLFGLYRRLTRSSPTADRPSPTVQP